MFVRDGWVQRGERSSADCQLDGRRKGGGKKISRLTCVRTMLVGEDDIVEGDGNDSVRSDPMIAGGADQILSGHLSVRYRNRKRQSLRLARFDL